MVRLPQTGGDEGVWGGILNDFLSVEHNSDGSLKKAGDIASAKAKADSAVQTVNNIAATSGNVSLAASDVSAIPASQKGAASGVASLDSGTKLTAAQLPTNVVTKSSSSGDTGKAIDAYTGLPLVVGGSGTPIWINAVDNGISASSASDQSSALASLYSAAPAGSVVYFPAGTYIGLHSPGKSLTILGASRRITEFRPPSSVTNGTSLVNFGAYTNCSIENILLNGQGNANLSRGVNFYGSSIYDKFGRVSRCRFSSFSSATSGVAPHSNGAAGVYGVSSNQIVIEDNEFVDCRYPIYMDYPGPQTIVRNNRIWAATRTLHTQGITFRYWSGETTANSWAGSLCEGNTVENVGYDLSGEGIEGNAIQVEHCRGVRVIGNTLRDCEAAGIHIAAGSFDCTVQGNIVKECGKDTAGAITFELAVDVSTSVGTGGTITGGSCTENEVFDNLKYGIQTSYSAGVVMSNNVVHDNGWEGIWVDADRCVISNNIVFNNCNLNAAPVPNSAPNVQAHIKITTGLRCIITGNQVFDTLTTPYADYAIAVNDANKHLIKDNILYGGFTTAAIYPTSASTSIIADNIST